MNSYFFLSKSVPLEVLIHKLFRFYDFVYKMTTLHPFAMRVNCINGFEFANRTSYVKLKTMQKEKKL